MMSRNFTGLGCCQESRRGRKRRKTRRAKAAMHLRLEALEPRYLLSGFGEPVATIDHYLTLEDSPVVGNMITDDTGYGTDDGGGQPLVVTRINDQPYSPGEPIVLDSGATLTASPSGDFVYDPTTSPELSSIPGGVPAVTDSFTYAVSASYTDIRVFGDSLSDMGNLYELTGGLYPSEHELFWEGRESNGPVWPEYLAPRLGLEVTTNNNLAVAGASTGRDNVHESWFPDDLPGVHDQIDQFVGSLSGQADPDALYVVWAGANNIFALESFDPTLVQETIVQAVEEIATAVGTLQWAGAEHIVVANMPDLALTPWIVSYNSPEMTAGAQLISVGFNTGLGETLNDYFPDVIQVDMFAAFHEVVEDPAAFGFSNVDEVCLDGTQVVGDPNEYLFWNDVHPTTKGHQALANFFYEELMVNEPLSLSDTAAVHVTVSDVYTPVAFVDGNLYIGGTSRSDSIRLGQDRSGQIHANVNGNHMGPFRLDPDARVVVVGHDGNDWIHAGQLRRSAIIEGGRGHDSLFGGWESDILRGGAGNDFLYGLGGGDELYGDGGSDFLFGGRGDDLLRGGEGDDFLFGGRGEDFLAGESGNDWLFGQLGDDELDGGDGDDWLFGGLGNDLLKNGEWNFS